MPGPRATVDRRRVATYLLVAFGLSWATAAAIYWSGGLADSPVVVGPLTVAGLLLPTTYMFAPALANVAARLHTGEGRGDRWLGLHLRPGWRYLLAAWVGPAVLTLLGAGLFFALFPRHVDPTLSALRGTLAGSDAAPAPAVAAVVQLVAALTVGPAINSLFAFGEEFGWRGYLLPALLPLGRRRAVLLVGVVWGVWHWPIVAMGYNYGLGYPGAPWTGLLAMVWFTVLVGTFLGWATLRAASVWPAVVGHAALNAVAGYGALFVRGQPNPLLGPLPVGVVGAVPWLVVAAWLLLRGRFDPVPGLADGDAPDEAATS